MVPSPVRARRLASRGSVRTALAGALVAVGLTGVGLAHQAAGAAASTRTTTSTGAVARLAPSQLREVNWFPVNDEFTRLWYDFQPTVIDSDMGRVAALGANTVRVFVPVSAFGYPTPSTAMTSELSQLVAIAASHGLSTHLTLFDYGFSAWTDIAGSRQWASAILAPYRGDSRIAVVEIRNELDLTSAAQLLWAQQLLPYVQTVSGGIPTTVSVSWSSTALSTLISDLGGAQPDLYDIHYYADPTWAAGALAAAVHLAGSRPVIVGETGYSTYASNSSVFGLPQTRAAQEAYQDQYYRTVELAARQAGIPPVAPWQVNDSTSTGCGGCTLADQNFGIFRVDGTAKPAAATVQAAFAGAPIDTAVNNGFESAAGPGTPALWRVYGLGAASFAQDTTVAHSGGASASIAASSAGGPSWFVDTVASPVAGMRYTLSVWVQGENATGTTSVSLGFWKNGASQGAVTSSALPAGTTGWTQLTVSGVAPVGATTTRISLSSSSNSGSVWFDDVSLIQG